MVERLTAPTESWRPQRRDSIFDPQMRRTALLAVGGVVVVALGVAGYLALPRHSTGIPVIEADSRPLRVKPDNPGGMQVIGVEEQSATGQSDVMAAPPEAPQVQALRAQIQAARQAAAPPPPPVMPAVITPSQPPVSQQAALPVPLPVPAQRVVLPPVMTRAPAIRPPVAAVPPSAGGTEVQLAAMETERAAMAEWSRLSKRMPELFASHHPSVFEAQRDGKTLYRLRTGGFADIAQATAFCTQVKSKGGGCAIASF